MSASIEHDGRQRVDPSHMRKSLVGHELTFVDTADFAVSGHSNAHQRASHAHENASVNAPAHRITSLARSRADGGMVRPSVGTVRLAADSNFVGCSIGRPASFHALE